jgi:hypothetical protein
VHFLEVLKCFVVILKLSMNQTDAKENVFHGDKL